MGSFSRTVIRVFVVDDHPLLRQGLTAALSAEPDLRVVAQAATGQETLRELGKANPDVVLLDLRLPDIDGPKTCRDLIQARPNLRIVVLTDFPDDAILNAAFAAGARGFVLKRSEPRLFRNAVRIVAGGGIYVDPKITSRLQAMQPAASRAKGPHGLTQQELRTLELLAKGLPNREIGERMGVSQNTVKTHVRNVLAKLGARDRAEAAAIAAREGLA